MLSTTTQPGSSTRALIGAFVLIAAVLTTLFATASPAVAVADDAAGTIGVATRPAGADGRPDDRTRFDFAVDPGQSVTDQVLVGNTGTERQDFTVYITDGYNAEDGSFALLATADEPTAIGTWVRFENGESRIQFSLDPEEVRLLTFTLQLPPEATPGDHVGGLVASVLEEGAQVSLDRRVATPVYARVSGELQPRLNIASVNASYEGDWWNPFAGTVNILYTVDNPGNVALAANATMSVPTWFGIPATGQRGGAIPVLLPGNSAVYEYELAGVGQWGYLNPAVRLNPFVDADDPALQLPVSPVTRDTVVIAMPWTLLIAVAIAVGVYFLLRWRRRRDEARAQEWIDYTEAQAQAAAAEKSGAPADEVVRS